MLALRVKKTQYAFYRLPRPCWLILLLLFLGCAVRVSSAQTGLNWESRARLHHMFGGKAGRLTLGPSGVEFHPNGGPVLHWPFQEIKTLDLLTPRHLVITDYQNRSWHRHGDRKFRFDLDTPMPPALQRNLPRSSESQFEMETQILAHRPLPPSPRDIVPFAEAQTAPSALERTASST